jgi:hypothetical protein
MSINPTINCTFIIRGQAEYSPAAQILSVRFILEMPATGQHRGFVDVEDLISALRIELAGTYGLIIPPEPEEGKP